MNCDAKIRPFDSDLELTCEHDDSRHDEHRSALRDYAYPGSVTQLVWMETDRRTFRGDWADCPKDGCILPANHRGSHAL